MRGSRERKLAGSTHVTASVTAIVTDTNRERFRRKAKFDEQVGGSMNDPSDLVTLLVEGRMARSMEEERLVFIERENARVLAVTRSDFDLLKIFNFRLAREDLLLRDASQHQLGIVSRRWRSWCKKETRETATDVACTIKEMTREKVTGGGNFWYLSEGLKARSVK